MKLFKKLGSYVLSAAMVLGLTFGAAVPVFAEDNPYAPTEFVEYDGVTFGRATAAYNTESKSWTGQTTTTVYEGMPLFDGNADHLYTYVNLLISEMGEDGLLNAISGTGTGTVPGTETTYSIPSAGGSADVGNDGGTQWPNQLALSQSWNTALVKEAGNQYGKEIRSEAATGSIATGGSITAHCAQVDPHQNPLAGRYDEAYGEDAFMSSVFTDAWGDGMSGRTTSGQDLYYQAMAYVKHWATYQSEIFRMQGSYNVSARTFYEYWAEAANRPAQNRSILGLMSSYGRLNYVPSTSAFSQTYIQSVAPDGMVSGCDFMSEYGYTASAGWMTGSAWSNGYDTFYSSSMYDRDALMVLAGHKQGGNAMAASFMGEAGAHLVYNHKDVLAQDVKAGVLGLTIDDITAVVRPRLINAVRTGICDERDANGQPKYYPFIVEEAHAASDYENHYHNNKEIQDVALQAGEESIVLLKNTDKVLPLNSAKAIDVYGTFADIYQYGLYSTALNQDVASGYATYSQQYPAAKTLVEALESKKYQYTFNSGREKVTMKIGGLYVAANADGEVYLTDDSSDAGIVWEKEDWGQDAYSFYSPVSGKWLDADIGDPSNAAQSVLRSTTLTATYDANFKAKSWGQTINSDFPDFFEIKTIGDKQYIKAGSKWNVTDFGANFAVPGLMGWYFENNNGTLALDCDEELGTSGTLVSTAPAAEAAGMGSQYELEITSVDNTITPVNDTAVIVVGAVYNGIAGEGVDRLYLNLGDGMVAQAQAIAKAYKEAGNSTVLIIKSDFPVVAEAFQNDENIDSILYMPMGGQYEAYAMTEVLYGDVNPSGKLTSTWYTSQAALPQMTEYGMPIDATTSTSGAAGNPMYGMGATGPQRDEDILDLDKSSAITGFDHVTLDDLAVVTDTANSDLQDTDLTYMYYNDEVTYPFGYGLSYTSFAYSDVNAPETVDGTAAFDVTLNVQNTGLADGAEVVEAYIAKEDSAYGAAAPEKKLVGFTKVNVKSNETAQATITIDPADFALWDVNAEKYVVEDGSYKLYISASSDLTNAIPVDLTVNGEALANLTEEDDVNVWEHSFDTSNLQYVEYSKGRTIEAAVDDAVRDDTFAVNSKGIGAYAALYGVDLNTVKSLTAHVASENDGNVIEIHEDSPDGNLLATFKFDHTEAVTENRPLTSTDAADQKYAGKYTELGYTEVNVPLTAYGVHNLYIVFQSKDTRLGSIDFETKEADKVYEDVAVEHWFYEPVMEISNITNAKGTKMMSGYESAEGEPKYFGPADSLTREQFAVMMYRLADEPETAYTADAFPDVPADQFYSIACCWAKGANVIAGYDNGKFGVMDPITREQVATILYRYATDTLKLDVTDAMEKGDLSLFSDGEKVSSWAKDPLTWANGAGIITGNEDGTIAPQGTAVRAHCAAIFTRFLDYLPTVAKN